MQGKIPYATLKKLDNLTYELNFLTKKIRALRNDSNISVDQFKKEISLFVEQLGLCTDRIEEWEDSLDASINSAEVGK